MPRALLYDGLFYDQQVAGSLASARIVLGALFGLIPCTSLVDIGCGVAPWVRTALDLGATDSLGLDGDYVDQSRLLVEPERFHVCDLETEDLRDAVPRPRPVDVALCMEVVEHLQPARAPFFIAELCTVSNLVLFSAAVPGQGGTNHINEQWPDYWSRHFGASDFDCFDILRPRLWREDGCEWWYLQNALIFARRQSAAWEVMARSAPPTPSPMPLVHPRKLEQLIANEIRYTTMSQSLQVELDRREVAHAQALQILRDDAAVLDQQNQATIDGLSCEVARLNDKLARQDAEREATFEATRLWMLRIERELAEEREGVAQEQRSARAAAAAAISEELLEAKGEILLLREMLIDLKTKLTRTTDALTTVKGQLSASLVSYQAQQLQYANLQSHHARLQAEHDALAARLLSSQAEQEILTRALQAAEGAATAAEATVKALYASTSWRVTGPMRAVRRVLS